MNVNLGESLGRGRILLMDENVWLCKAWSTRHKRLSVRGMDKMGPSGETGGRNNVH